MIGQVILTIRQDVQKINSKRLRKEHYIYGSADCTEDGVVDYYFDGKAIVKIVESGAIGDGSWVNEYYYRAGKVIFCFETIVGGPAVGKVTKTGYRFYVKDDSPLKTMEGAKTVKSDSKAISLSELQTEYLKLMHQKILPEHYAINSFR